MRYALTVTWALRGCGVGTWQGEQVVLLLDGLDSLRSKNAEDPLAWLPRLLPPGVRVIGTARPIGRVVYACDGEC